VSTPGAPRHVHPGRFFQQGLARHQVSEDRATASRLYSFVKQCLGGKTHCLSPEYPVAPGKSSGTTTPLKTLHSNQTVVDALVLSDDTLQHAFKIPSAQPRSIFGVLLRSVKAHIQSVHCDHNPARNDKRGRQCGEPDQRQFFSKRNGHDSADEREQYGWPI
jgi:hypothetical protein